MKTILIVDDEPLIGRMLTRVLKHAGYRVVTHDTGFGLSNEVREHAPDLLLLDINMPGLAGDAALTVLRGLRERFPALDVPVIFHSGMPQPHLEALAREHDAVGFLSKPAGNAEVLAMVQRILGPAASEATTR